MTEHKHLALLCAVVVIGLLASPVMAMPAPGEHIYRGFDKAQNYPDIDGSTIVWEDDRNGDMDIYLGTIDEFRSRPTGYTGERLTDNLSSQERPSISGDYVVWQDDRNGNWDIYLYKRSTDETTQLTNDTGNQRLPAIHGDYIAWYDDSSGDTNIVIYDIAAGSVKDVIERDARTTIPFTSVTTEFKPALSEKYLAWVDDADGERIWYYDIQNEEVVGPISTIQAIQSWPSLYGSTIAWEDYRHGSGDSEIYMTDLDDPSGGEERITTAPRNQVSPAISGSIIAWEDTRDESRSIYLYDLSAEKEMSVFVPEDAANDEQLYPAVSDNTIVWQRGKSPDSNLYMFVYDPAGLTEPVPTAIEVTPLTATLAINETEQFNATVLDQDSNAMTDVAINWTSGNETVGTIDADGVFTALAAGTANVTATAGNVTGEATVTVSAEELILTEITIAPLTATLAINETEQFTATALDQFGNAMTDVAINWTSSNETVGMIDAEGVFTAHAEGTANVTATAGDVTGEATVTVSAEELILDSIQVTPLTATLAINETEQFNATALDQFGNAMTDVAINWTSGNEAVGTIDAEGVFTALAAGTTNVTATADNVTGSATVIVEEPILDSIQVTPTGATLGIGDTQRFIVTARDQDGNVMSDVAINWTSSNETVGTIDADGFFSALDDGTATVTATAENVTATANVTVNNEDPALASIVVTPSEITFGSNETQQFTATAFDQFGAEIAGVEIAWTSSDETVGTIDADGLFSALDDGTATVTATVENVTGTAEVTVTTASSGVVVSPSTITLNAGDSRQFTATVYDPEGNETSDAVVTWTISDEMVGTIDADGLFSALEEGTATITATAENETGTAMVTVELPPAPTRIEIEPTTATILPGETRQFTATVYDQRDNQMDWISVTWSSSDLDAGSIDRAGLFAAFAEGTTNVMASAGDASAEATVTVSATAVPEPTPVTPGSSGGGGGGGSSEPTFCARTCENLRSGDTFMFSDLTTSSVGSVNVTAASAIPRMMLTVKKTTAPSAAEPPAGDVYEYVAITPNWVGPNAISSAEVFFTVPTDWLEGHNITAEDVRLMRYVDGAWQPLETEVIGEENGNYRFQATTSGFSTFAIAASPVDVKASAEEVNATIETTETPDVTETPEVTGNVTTEPTAAAPTTTPAAPLVYAPLLAPLAFLLWGRRKN
ncbi:MAG: hypothetical protein CVV35_04110 [Methanomicrobiales archaeon HGW-Methanomicrobiales-6]|jgi:PGF-pre-PGF domain-containing protein|nr:MAG: hypothetical protein CVV35_04110 [Methanomicrobiales archaeon HGW-Methanomicrobiales-6]